MARWHSSAEFDAEQMLRQSGLFDYSAPQFFHMRSWRNNQLLTQCHSLVGLLNCFYYNELRCEFENSFKASASSALLGNHISSPQVVLGAFYSLDLWDISQLNGKLSRLFYRHEDPYNPLCCPLSSYNECPNFVKMPQFLALFARLLHSGEDINQLMHIRLLRTFSSWTRGRNV